MNLKNVLIQIFRAAGKPPFDRRPALQNQWHDRAETRSLKRSFYCTALLFFGTSRSKQGGVLLQKCKPGAPHVSLCLWRSTSSNSISCERKG